MVWNGFDTCLGTMAVQRCGVSTATSALHHCSRPGSRYTSTPPGAFHACKEETLLDVLIWAAYLGCVP